jgi:hypothetical protein
VHGRGVFENLPSLDGKLHLDEGTRAACAQDYGCIVSEQPLAVLKPGIVIDIGQSVGGTLTVGGIGGMVHRQRELFEAVLAGQGQVGVIGRATLKLVRAAERSRI